MNTHNVEAIIIVRLLLSICCGGVIGFEYKIKSHFAGLKTFSLVCMGATIAMITNEYICSAMPDGGDPTKIAAQIISGIGFLGAGTIIVTNHNQVIGLSTAAALWVTAAIGISIGAGFYFCGILGAVTLLILSSFYRMFDKKIMRHSKILCIYVALTDKVFMEKLIDALHKNKIRIISISRETNGTWSKKAYCAMIELKLNEWLSHEHLLSDLQKIDGVQYIEEEMI